MHTKMPSTAALNQKFVLLAFVDNETPGYTEAWNAMMGLTKLEKGEAPTEEGDVDELLRVWEENKPKLLAALRKG